MNLGLPPPKVEVLAQVRLYASTDKTEFIRGRYLPDGEMVTLPDATNGVLRAYVIGFVGTKAGKGICVYDPALVVSWEPVSQFSPTDPEKSSSAE